MTTRKFDQSLIIKQLKDRVGSLEQENEQLKTARGVEAYERKLEEKHDRKLDQLEKEHRKQLRQKEQECKNQLKEKDREIRALKDSIRELNAELKSKDKENKKLYEALEQKDEEFQKVCKENFQNQLALQRQIDALNTQLRGVNKQIRTLETRKRRAEDGLEKKDKKIRTIEVNVKDLEQKVQILTTDKQKMENTIAKITAQLNQNSTNSSLPSSRDPNHKVYNSREKTGKKPGAQSGHTGHNRPWLTPDQVIILDPPACVKENPEAYVRVEGKTKTHINVDVELQVSVTGYTSECWRLADPQAYAASNYQQIWSPFPKNLQNEMNYGSTMKSLCLLLTQDLNAAAGKVSDLIGTLTHGKIRPSVGMINQLTTEFENKAQPEIQQIWADLLNGKFMHTDATYLRLDGKMAYACICTNGVSTLYQGRLHKGHEMVKGTPIELYKGIIISDREAVFVNTSPNDHQICLIHIDRELKGIIENEPDKKWAVKMKKYMKKTVEKYGDKEASETEREALCQKFFQIIEEGIAEYDRKPEGYVKGYNLLYSLKKMEEEKGAVLYFVAHEEVPAQNNAAERGARSLKRKTRQAEGFRSIRGLNGTCAVKSVLDTGRAQGENKLELCRMIMER